MFNRLCLVLLCGFFIFFSGCASSIQAPKMSNGNSVTLFLHCDDGITNEMTDKEVEQVKEVSAFMKQHFIGLASKSGYRPMLIEASEDYEAKPGQYLIKVKIKRYNPGNKALRVVVGFGAGAVSMDTYYELYSDVPTPILSKEDGVGSSNPNWIVVPAKLNEKMLSEVTNKIKSSI